MATATLTVPATPEQARTARLVVGAAARRAGVDPDVLDDVRLAVAEAVARAVLRALAAGVAVPVAVAMTDDGTSFRVDVTDGSPPSVTDGEDEMEERLAVAVIQSLAPGSTLTDTPDGGRTVSLVWPTA